MEVSQKTKNTGGAKKKKKPDLPYDPTILLLGIYLKRIKTY